MHDPAMGALCTFPTLLQNHIGETSLSAQLKRDHIVSPGSPYIGKLSFGILVWPKPDFAVLNDCVSLGGTPA
jgi:hypothetical protein